jgi:hypothetical protein
MFIRRRRPSRTQTPAPETATSAPVATHHHPTALPVWSQHSAPPLARNTNSASADVVYQGGGPATGPTLGTATGTTCPTDYIHDVINPAYDTARTWISAVSRWNDRHAAHLQQRGRLTTGDNYVRVGRPLYNDLMLLERHFRISREMRPSILPASPDDYVNIHDLNRFGSASYWVRRRFQDVTADSGLTFNCEAECPTGRTGSEVLGSAVAGSKEVTFYRRCFDAQGDKTKAGVALHEAFHASFTAFDHDTYSFESSYPGRDALTNAESFAMFGAIVATGSTYRITQLPEITIHGEP